MATRQILISLHLASTIIMIMASLCPENPSAIVTHSNNNGKSQLPKDLCNKLKCDMKKRKCGCCKNNQIVCNSVDMALDSVSKMGRPDSVKIVLYSAPANLISQCPSDSHVITGMHNFSDVHLLEFVGGYKYNNSLLCCNSRSPITMPGSCEVYLKNVTITNCLIKYNVMNTVIISSSGIPNKGGMRIESHHNLEQLFTNRKIKSTQISMCQPSVSRNIHDLCEREQVLCACNYETDEDVTICIKEGYWYGEVDNTTVTAPCEYNKCKVSIFQGTEFECPLTENSDVKFYEKFSNMLINGNCTPNRNGILCSECDENHAFTFGAYKCVDFDYGKYAGAIIISITFVLLIITGLLFNLRFHDVNLASINGFVLFFSIVDHLVPEVEYRGRFKADYVIEVFVSIFESFSQLQPEFLSFVPFPFVPKSCKALCTVGLQYIFPLSILIFLPSIVPILSNCCPKKCQKCAFRSNTWVKSICLIFLLTFTSLTETSILILQPIQFDGIKGNYIFLQPESQYLGNLTHKVLFSLAIIIEVLLTIAVIIFLLSPYLTRFQRCNSLKLKPFLDEFQGGYKERYRFMAASYFIYRQVILWIMLFPNYTDATSAIHLVTMVKLIVHLAIRPYRSRLLNITDGMFLTTLLLISYIYKIPYFQNEDQRTFRTVIISILLIFPASYPFLLLILPYCPYIKNYRAETTRNIHSNSRLPPLIIQEENEPKGLRTRIASFFCSIRSSYFRSNKAHSIDNETIGAPLTTSDVPMTVIDGFDMQGEEQTDSTVNVSKMLMHENYKDSVISSARLLSESELSNENKKRKNIRPYHSAGALTTQLLQAIPENN